MGWFFALLFAALSLIALWQSKNAPRVAIELAAALILAALAGYAWQGSPSLPGSPRSAPLP